ncbi:coatomer subunit epsilon KNAG_0C04170 [Huiozyma naganishii CBS 8797]|uniref:Coatomer subunit epsilon n=1 Tax=Huiozyma naganishii (strain ATCC MYA-139 / BCRC 22969 / CBS 8797 / KCTC 17520 / NBRC 10181 / NCYC 3082 / Yp74L-3) TaxID=1071383 RepID=J7S4X5_HUIN7|nr:hypothetical protein KNAG_0C04170 [Kazachstania naganishii CBS 8797]CCK69519.1 hypothetical protein KNAG_0C04170 [Kazachstania naganishii CBS 8797]
MDYFSIKQNYYAGDFAQALTEVQKFNKTEDDTLLFYKMKCDLALGTYSKGASHGSLGKKFDLYAKFLQDRDISALEKSIAVDSSSPYELNLLASAQAVLGQLDDSLETCVAGIDSDDVTGTTELLLLGIQVTLLNGQFSIAQTMLENFISGQEGEVSSEDELIINLAESYVKFATNEDTTSSNFYYFEELAQTFPSWKTQLSLLNMHLQQVNIEESRGIVQLLESDYYAVEQKEAAAVYRPHFLASKITLAILEGSSDLPLLREELIKLDPHHRYVVSHKNINAKFDDVIAKYKA